MFIALFVIVSILRPVEDNAGKSIELTRKRGVL